MRKFLLALCFSFLAPVVCADDLPAIAGLKAFRVPMDGIVSEAGKGPAADLAAIAAAYADADKAWKQVLSEPLDLGRYGVPADKQEETWSQVRMLGMLVGYLDEAVKRGDRALALRAAGMLKPAYDKLAGSLGAR